MADRTPLVTLSDCPGFTWSGDGSPGSLYTCHHCDHVPWEHDRRLTSDGTPAQWPPGLVGYWFHQKHITADRAQHLGRRNPGNTPAATR